MTRTSHHFVRIKWDSPEKMSMGLGVEIGKLVTANPGVGEAMPTVAIEGLTSDGVGVTVLVGLSYVVVDGPQQ